MISRIKPVKLEDNHKLVSFDVTSLFTNVPITPLLEALEILFKSNGYDDDETKTLLELCNLCVSNNLFLFNNKVYELTEGLPMGSSLSPIFSNIFMDFLETKLNENPFFKRVVAFYCRYVDDIFCIINGSREDINSLLEIMNSLFPTIKFTVEHETNGKLPFLDLFIAREHDKLIWKIYEKDSKSHNIIPNFSYHTYPQKMAFFHSSFHRILTYLYTENEILTEKNKVIDIGIQHGYKREKLEHIFNKMEGKMKKKTSIALLNTEKVQKEKPIGNIIFTKTRYMNSNTKHFLRDNGYRILEKPGKKIKNILNDYKKTNTSDPFYESGIYQIQCEDCNKRYIGQTYRTIKQRCREHLNSVNMGDANYRKSWDDVVKKSKEDKSGFLNHIAHNCHSTSWSSAQVIETSDPKSLDLKETFHIQQSGMHNLMNKQQGPLFSTSSFKLYQKLKTRRNQNL